MIRGEESVEYTEMTNMINMANSFGFDAQSQSCFNKIPAKHKSSNKLKEAIKNASDELTPSTSGMFVSLKGNLSPLELLNGLLCQGEQVVSKDIDLPYSSITLKNTSGVIVNTYYGGTAILSDQRLLLISSSYHQGQSLTEFGDSKKLPGGYSVTMSCADSVIYLPISLSRFKSVNMVGRSGVTETITLTGTKPCLGGWLCCCYKSWYPEPKQTMSMNEMVLNFGVLMPPWDERMTLEVMVNPSVPITIVRDFLSLFQTHAKQLH